MANKKIAAITTVRNDAIFLPKWISYYGKELGFRSLFVILDGYDQERPECDGVDLVNFIQLPFRSADRVSGDKRRARVMSHFAAGLFQLFDAVIATDVDEFLLVDPDTNTSLVEYLTSLKNRTSVSGLGLDVGQHILEEQAIDDSLPMLGQRRYAHLSARYTKPSTAFRPVIWGSGMHRIKGHGFTIDPNLYLFHFGMIDYAMSTGKTADKDRLATGWGGHLERREALFKIIAEATPEPFETTTQKARKTQSLVRPLYAWNKPSLPGRPRVVEIPERFFGLV